ncbi:MAG: MFS transporter, partial [Pseudomonadota bacterium]
MNLILADSRYLRYFSFTIFYIAQGLPFGLVSYALPAFLAERGVEPAAIAGFIAVASLPWSFKLLAGPLMDRFTCLAMGRRRPWVILAQIGMVLTGVAFAFFPEGLDNIAVLTTLCFLLNCFSATQDVAVDGMAIDVLPVDEQGRANAFMAFGQVLGISVSSAISAFV